MRGSERERDLQGNPHSLPQNGKMCRLFPLLHLQGYTSERQKPPVDLLLQLDGHHCSYLNLLPRQDGRTSQSFVCQQEVVTVLMGHPVCRRHAMSRSRRRGREETAISQCLCAAPPQNHYSRFEAAMGMEQRKTTPGPACLVVHTQIVLGTNNPRLSMYDTHFTPKERSFCTGRSF